MGYNWTADDEIVTPRQAFMLCRGGLTAPIRINPGTGSGECQECGRRFDRNQFVGKLRSVPLHKHTYECQQ
jgi:hypothetical protein